jgi:hypothetical protein
MVTNLYAQAARLSLTVPIEPIKAILDAFGSHQLVALGEPHGNEQAAAFRIALIRDARFADVVTDIVVESGNSRFQDVVDAFVSGQRVHDTTLRQVWQKTTVANFVWERPIYEQFFRTVRDVNASLVVSKNSISLKLSFLKRSSAPDLRTHDAEMESRPMLIVPSGTLSRLRHHRYSSTETKGLRLKTEI